MGYESTLYNLVLLLHILAAIVGFGGIALNSIYLARARALPGQQGHAVLEANSFVTSKVSEMAIYATFLFGIVLIIVSDGAIEFSEGWISAAFAVMIIMVGVIHGMIRPATRQLIELSGSGSGTGEAGGLERRVTIGTAVLNVLLVIALALMIWQPGA
ncbi:MAG: hypothetical protein S0880_18940 [Actinomycetota bacterium]|nr:hypothetical protein [Actinomycetota bacterium]